MAVMVVNIGEEDIKKEMQIWPMEMLKPEAPMVMHSPTV